MMFLYIIKIQLQRWMVVMVHSNIMYLMPPKPTLKMVKMVHLVIYFGHNKNV